MSPNDLMALCASATHAAKRAGADEAEVYAVHSEDTTVGFQKNDLDQVSEAQETTFGVRVFRGKRLGFATSNRPDRLHDVVERAVQMTSHTPVDPHNGLADPRPVPQVEEDVDPVLAAWTTEDLVRLGVRLMRRVAGTDRRITVDTAEVSLTDVTRAVVSTTGVRSAHRGLTASGGIFGMAIQGDEVGSFSYDGDLSRSAAHAERAIWGSYARFIDKALGALGARSAESFTGSIILPPEEVAGFLVRPLLQALGANAVRKGTSPLAEKLGERVAAESLNLYEGGRAVGPHQLAGFDREGAPRRRLDLIHRGVLSAFLYDSYEARVAGVESSGHAGGGASTLPTVGAATVGISPGDTPKSHLYRGDRAVVVTRYSGSNNPTSGDFSGVVKGGFLLDEGEQRPIHETTITGNLYTCLTQLSGVSEETLVLNGTQRLPWIRIDGVHITAATSRPAS